MSEKQTVQPRPSEKTEGANLSAGANAEARPAPDSQSKITRRLYTQEFKKTAVSLVLEQGYTYAQAAGLLNISPSTLSNWVMAARANRPLNDSRPGVDSQHIQLSALEAENKRLRKEVRLLKKFLAYLEKGKRL